MKEQFKELLAGMGGGERYKSFEDWLNAKEGIEIIQKGKKKRKKGKKLPYAHWIYIEDNGFGPGPKGCPVGVSPKALSSYNRMVGRQTFGI